MKNYITPNYVFTPGISGVGTIDTNIINFNSKLLVAIINITREVIIYSPAISGKGYTNITGDTITLEFDTSSQNSLDILQIIYESTSDYPSFVDTGLSQPLTNQELISSEIIDTLRQSQSDLEILKNTIGQTRVDSSGRIRILLDSITGGVTLTTLTTLTNQTQIGGYNANDQVISLRRLQADTLLSKINIT
jgi:hypothetical protein